MKDEPIHRTLRWVSGQSACCASGGGGLGMNEQRYATSVTWLIGQFTLFPVAKLVHGAELLLMLTRGLHAASRQI